MISRLQSWIITLSNFERDLEDQGWIIAWRGDSGRVYCRARQDKENSL
jgi:hypothetical protein